MRTSPTCIRESGHSRSVGLRHRHHDRHRGVDRHMDSLRPGGPRARRGDVQLALLKLLAEAPANGYSLIGQISDRTEGRWRPSPGSVYPVLRRLAEQGFVVAENEGEETAGFAITDEGRAFLTEQSEQAANVWQNGRAFTESQEQLHQSLRKLMGATRELSESGSEDQRARANTLIDEVRRKIYGILAE